MNPLDQPADAPPTRTSGPIQTKNHTRQAQFIPTPHRLAAKRKDANSMMERHATECLDFSAMRVVLIYGPRKGGTTFAQRVVDGNGLFVLPGETKIKAFPSLREKASENAISQDEIRYFFQTDDPENDFEIDNHHLEWECRKHISGLKTLKDYIELQVKTTASAMRTFPLSLNQLGFAVKEVGGEPDIVIAAFLHAFPEALVLNVLRKPEGVVSAIIRDRTKKGGRLSVKQIIKEAMIAEITHQQQLGWLSHPNIHSVWYEEFIDSDVRGKTIKDLGLIPVSTAPTMNGHQRTVKTASVLVDGLANEPADCVRNGRSTRSGKPSHFDELLIFIVVKLTKLLKHLRPWRVRGRDGTKRCASL